MASKQKFFAEDKTIKDIFFKTSGRLPRLRYFACRIILFVLTMMFLFIGYKIIGYEYGQVTTGAVICNGIITTIFLIPKTCLNIRRLQDMNKGKTLAIIYVAFELIMAFSDFTYTDFWKMPAYAYLILTLATFSMFLDLYLMISPGTYGRNKYGENPLVKKVNLKKADN